MIKKEGKSQVSQKPCQWSVIPLPYVQLSHLHSIYNLEQPGIGTLVLLCVVSYNNMVLSHSEFGSDLLAEMTIGIAYFSLINGSANKTIEPSKIWLAN